MPVFKRQQINVDTEDIQKAINRLQKKAPQQVEGVITMAIMDTLDYAEKQVFKQITKVYDITEASIRGSRGFRLVKEPPKKGFTLLPASWGSANVGGRVLISSRRLPVIKFNVIPMVVPPQAGIPVGSRQIVSVMLKRIPRAGHAGKPNRFLARMPSGHLGVYMRKETALNPGGTHRIRADGQRTQLPIQEEFMISPSEMIGSSGIRPKIESTVGWYFMRSLLGIARTRGLV